MKVVRRKILGGLLTVALVTIAVFLLFEALPGDPAAVIAGEFASDEAIQNIRQELRLDDPIAERYARFVSMAMTGDLGSSVKVRTGIPVSDLIWQALPATASLVFVSLTFSLLIALPIGYLAGSRRGSAIDRFVTAGTSAAMAIPPFVLGLVLVSVLAIDRRVFPAVGYQPLHEGLGGWLRSLALPAFTLGVVSAAELTRQTRGAFVDVLERDYVRTAVAKGMSRRVVVWKHALKNAAPPIVVVTGLQVARLIGGTVIVERIFVVPGLGSLALSAVSGRDITLVRGVVLFIAVIVIVINLLVDLVGLYLNPRARV